MTARREALTGYAFLLPSLFGVAAFLLLPIVAVGYLSLQQWSLIGTPSFAGFSNWVAVFRDGRFLHAIATTLLFVVIALPLQIAAGLVVALCLRRPVRGMGAFRTILLVPWVCAPLTLGVVWKWVFTPDGGLLNTLTGHRVEWLSEPALVLPAVIGVYVWSNTGYTALFFSAALGSVPPALLDAARLDGAGRWRVLRSVELPLIRPTFFFVVVTGLIASFQLFDLAYALAPNGGPDRAADLVAGRIYAEAFEQFRYGQASVMALVLFAVIALATALQQAYFRRRTFYEVDA